ncbi:MAG: hypothetical protein M3Q61_01300 [Chloroflexota bacterium]|nr:hypothetical protein [Chloroflexota bacterium]
MDQSHPDPARRGAAALGTIGHALAFVVRHAMHPGAAHGLPERAPWPAEWMMSDEDEVSA